MSSKNKKKFIGPILFILLGLSLLILCLIIYVFPLVESFFSDPQMKLNSTTFKKNTPVTNTKIFITTFFVNSSPQTQTNNDDVSSTSESLPKHTLTNAEIEKNLMDKMPQLKSCQLNLIKGNQVSTGKIVLNISISGKGKIVEIEKVESDFSDIQFVNCLLSVVRSIKFRRFTGPSIKAQLPLVFEK